jgi:hypothetical protein
MLQKITHILAADLIILADSRLLFKDHINSIVAKSSQRSGAIFRGFVSRNLTLMRKAFVTYVRPILEYNSCIWNPSHKHLTDTIENVQRRYTKRIPSLSSLSYPGHSHCVQFHGDTSSMLEITASIIQGSAIGPASYVVTASDLRTVTPGNEMLKYADDTYLLVPASNVESRKAELDNIERWASANNLKLNRAKTTEIIFVDKSRRLQFPTPPLMAGINRDTSLKILGVRVNSSLTFSEHICEVLRSCASTVYALRVLRSHGLLTSDLQNVYRTVVVAKLTYASSAWIGLTSATDRSRIDAFFRRSKRAGFCDPDLPTFEELCHLADTQLFNSILSNPQHILSQLLPPASIASQNYSLRPRKHQLELPEKINRLVDSNFIVRMLYQY